MLLIVGNICATRPLNHIKWFFMVAHIKSAKPKWSDKFHSAVCLVVGICAKAKCLQRRDE